MIKEQRKKLERVRAIRRVRQRRALKKWFKPLIAVGFITLILSSCLWVFSHMGDPIMNITFLNHTNAPVTITIQPPSADTHLSLTNRTNAQNSSFTEAKQQDTNTLYLPKLMDKQGYMFGMGYWKEADIQTTSQKFGKITISTEDKTITYETPEQIERLLKTNWEKSGKENSIKIPIE